MQWGFQNPNNHFQMKIPGEKHHWHHGSSCPCGTIEEAKITDGPHSVWAIEANNTKLMGNKVSKCTCNWNLRAPVNLQELIHPIPLKMCWLARTSKFIETALACKNKEIHLYSCWVAGINDPFMEFSTPIHA